jgi:hypothetical protein
VYFLNSLNKRCIWSVLKSRYINYSINLKSAILFIIVAGGSKIKGVQITSGCDTLQFPVPITDVCHVAKNKSSGSD